MIEVSTGITAALYLALLEVLLCSPSAFYRESKDLSVLADIADPLFTETWFDDWLLLKNSRLSSVMSVHCQPRVFRLCSST